MSANLKFLDVFRGLFLLLAALYAVAFHANACELQSEHTNFNATIDYDVFAFDRAGTSLQLRIRNTGSATCTARLALLNGSGQIAPLNFPEIGLDVEASVSSGMNQHISTLHSSSALVELPADRTTDLTIDFFTEQYDAISAGDYELDISVVLIDVTSEARLIDLAGSLNVSVEARAQINLAGTAGNFGTDTYSDMIFFEEPEPGDRSRFFVQSRSNAQTTLTIRSQNGGKMTNPNIPENAVHYDFIFEGEEVDLTSPWTISNRLQTDSNGLSEEVIVQISEDNKPFFAGDYEDIITIEIVTQ